MRRLLLPIALALLSACTGDDQIEIQEWIKQAEQQQNTLRLEPLPKVLVYTPVAYTSGNFIDPFRVTRIGGEVQRPSTERPSQDRVAEPLESYPLESLRFVGLLTKTKDGIPYALIQAEGALYQVRKGNHIGQNFGVITDISEEGISLKEFVQDQTGAWVEKESSLMLQGTEVAK